MRTIKMDLMGGKDTALTPRDTVLKFFPNLAFTHEDTRFQVYREFKPTTDTIEFTVYYREPDAEKFRIDAETFHNPLAEDYELDYRDIRIVRWMSQIEYADYLRRKVES